MRQVHAREQVLQPDRRAPHPLGKPGRHAAHHGRTCRLAAARPLIHLFTDPPLPGAPSKTLAREGGYALKLIAPGLNPRLEPPGQGQVLVSLRGECLLEEQGGADGKVVSTTRKSSQARLSPGQLFRVANDARWSARALDASALLFTLATSVPREHERRSDLFALAAARRHMGSVRLFGNEVVQLELLAARGRLPLRGWMPWRPSAPGFEYFLVLAGSFRLRLRPGGEHRLSAGSLLTIPPGPRHQVSALGSELAIGLVIRARGSLSSEHVRREDVRGFTPFS